jgi:hypothetical protein
VRELRVQTRAVDQPNTVNTDYSHIPAQSVTFRVAADISWRAPATADGNERTYVHVHSFADGDDLTGFQVSMVRQGNTFACLLVNVLATGIADDNDTVRTLG